MQIPQTRFPHAHTRAVLFAEESHDNRWKSETDHQASVIPDLFVEYANPVGQAQVEVIAVQEWQHKASSPTGFQTATIQQPSCQCFDKQNYSSTAAFAVVEPTYCDQPVTATVQTNTQT